MVDSKDMFRKMDLNLIWVLKGVPVKIPQIDQASTFNFVVLIAMIEERFKNKTDVKILV